MRSEEKLREILGYWKDFEIPDYVEREFNEGYLESDKVLTVTGPRRAGKTFLCFQLIDNIDAPSDNVVYINFEDERLHPINGDELTKLLDIYKELFDPEDGKKYFFLDEVHVVPNWEKWVRRVTEKERSIKIIITGSSSELMPEELSTELRGRALNKTVYPFSFQEFLDLKQIEFDPEQVFYSDQKPVVKKAFNDYVQYGGFPETVLEDDKELKREILQNYYSTIFQRDIVERYKVNNIEAMKDFYKIRVDSFGTQMTYTQSKNNLKSLGHKIGKTTLKRYLSHARNAFLLFDLEHYSPSTKKRKRRPRKVYPVDTGLVNAVRFDFSEDWGRALETVTFLELKRKGKNVFYHDGEKGECDFLIKEKKEITQAIQVTETLKQNKEREIQGIKESMKKFNLEKGLILTEDEKEKIETEEGQIKVEPVWKWLINH